LKPLKTSNRRRYFDPVDEDFRKRWEREKKDQSNGHRQSDDKSAFPVHSHRIARIDMGIVLNKGFEEFEEGDEVVEMLSCEHLFETRAGHDASPDSVRKRRDPATS
jgi:hypothetical protein